MSAKKPLLPPGSRWKTLDRSQTPSSHLDDDDPQNFSQEATPQLIASPERIKLSSSPVSPRSRTLHPRWHSSDDLFDIKNTSTLPRSCVPVDEDQSPPNRPQNGSVSDKPAIVPRKMPQQVNRTKPQLPRKPRTVYVTNRTGPAIPPKPKPPPTTRKSSGLLKKPPLTKDLQPGIKEPKLPSGLLKKFNSPVVTNSTEHPHPLGKNSIGNGEPLEVPRKAVSPVFRKDQSKDFTDHVVVRRDRERTTEKNLEKNLLKGKVAKQTGSPAGGSSPGSERPSSMIINSTTVEEDLLPSYSTIPRSKHSRESKKLAMTTTTTTTTTNKQRKGIFQKLKRVLQLGDASISSSSEEEEEATGEDEVDMDSKGGTIKYRPKLRHVSTKEMEKKRASMVDSADPSHEYRHLFEFVLVVGLRRVETTSGKLEPHVTYRFPPASQQEISKDQALQEIPNFCFPDANGAQPVTEYSSETFSFVLTDVNGNRRFGYCRKLLPSGTGPRLPEVYCIVSSLGCFSMYKKILDNLEERRKASPSAAFTLLKAIMANPFPAPGKSIEVSAFNAKGDGMQVIKFTRPMDSRLEHIDFSVLFSCLDIKHIIQLFSAMLMERRIIFCAEKLSTFSSCCHAATSLLYPCDWLHIFIPVLPNKLIDFCCSPLPYILGILPQNLPLLEDMDMEEAYIIHLDKGKALNKIGDESMILPAKAKAYLQEHLAIILEQWEQQGILDSTAISDTFITFFAYLFGNYPQFMEVKNPETDEKTFKTDKYIKSFSSEAVRRFLDAFQNTQMFNVFIQERDTPSIYSTIANGYFEKHITRLKERSKDIDTMNTGHSLASKWKKFARKFKSS